MARAQADACWFTPLVTRSGSVDGHGVEGTEERGIRVSVAGGACWSADGERSHETVVRSAALACMRINSD